MVEKLVSVSVITLQKRQCSAHAIFLWSSASTRDACSEFHEEGIEKFEGISHAVLQESSVYPVEFVRQFVFLSLQ
jgi:hypothetical protein